MSQLPLYNADAMALIKIYVEKKDQAAEARGAEGIAAAQPFARLASMAAMELIQQHDLDVDDLVDEYRAHVARERFVTRNDEVGDLLAQRVYEHAGLGYFGF